ncbi:MAG: helix-turn-helix domain-containing protein [Terriglobia bacterium]|jgi:excisionase family DNA binding protein
MIKTVSKFQQVNSKVMRSGQAAAYLGISVWKLRELIRQGKVGYVSDSDHTSALRFLISDLDEYLENSRVPARRKS